MGLHRKPARVVRLWEPALMGIPGASAGDPVCGMRRADVPMPGAVEAPEKQIVERLGIVWSVCSSIFHPLVEP